MKNYKANMPMMSQRELERQYNAMLKLESIAGEVKPNRVNNYWCKSCHRITKTIDRHKGVTPFMFNCQKCNGEAVSSFYQDEVPDRQPTIEWYRPTLAEAYKLRKSPNVLDHVLNGGLLHRPIINAVNNKFNVTDANGPTGHGDTCMSDADPGL